MVDWIINFYTNSAVVPFFFWGPVFINGVVYPIHVWKRVQKDRKAIESNEKYYSDFIKVGDLFWYFFCTVIPVVNALACIFNAVPIAWDYVSHRFDWLFRLQLVRDTRPKN